MKICRGTLFIIITLSLSALSMPSIARNVRDTLHNGATVLLSENKGQWESNVLFKAQMHSTTLFLEKDRFTFVVQHPDNDNLKHFACEYTQNGRYRQHSYQMRFDGCTTNEVRGTEQEEGYENYFIGRDKSKWATDVHTFRSAVYNNLYNNIDLKIYTAQNAMKYDFLVYPGGRTDDIVMAYESVDGVKLKGGNIVVTTSVKDIVELHPYAYQIIDGAEKEVYAKFKLKNNKITFEIGDYDTLQTLVIDPYLHFSTYTGSHSDNWGATGCYDSKKNTYTSGLVFGARYPVSLGAYDGTYNGNADIGIFKFDTNGSQRIYATYIGGSLADMPHSTYANSFDELLIFGTTGSADFPVTPNAYDTSFNGGTRLYYEGASEISFYNGSDLFICRLSEDGRQLQASTYVGGRGNDGLNYRNSFSYRTTMLGNDSLYFNYGDGARGEIITDDMNNIYVGSSTTSTDFPVTAGCIQSFKSGGQDGVVFKIDYNLSHLLWSTYLGGVKDDAIYSVDCDKDYNIVVCGGTNSINFPTTRNAYSRYYNGGSADAFVSKISYHGTDLMASTLYGSTAYDQSYFVRCGKDDDVFLFGQTKASGSTLIHNASYNTPNSGQFLTRFTPNLDTLVWSTVFGDGSGEPNISPTAFAVDICDRIYLSGWGRIFLGYTFGAGETYYWNTHGTTNLTVTPDAYQSSTDGQDFYIMSLDMSASNLVYATFFGEQHTGGLTGRGGGDHVDGGTSRFDRHGTLYQSVCASCGGSDAFPLTTSAYGQHNNSSNCNNAIFRLNLSSDFPVAEFTSTSTGCAPVQKAFNNTGRGNSWLWDFGDGTTSTQKSPTHTYNEPGQYTVTLVAYMPDGCKKTDTAQQTFVVFGNKSYRLDTLTTCSGMPVQLGLKPQPRVNYLWLTHGVSDSSIANPVATQPGTYVLLSWAQDSSANCFDTIFQTVVTGEAKYHIEGDTLSCKDMTSLNIVSSNSVISYQWSSNRNLSDTLNTSPINSRLETASSTRWLYTMVKDIYGCKKLDSVHISSYSILDSVRTTDVSCLANCDGSAVATVTTKAVAPLQYKWGDSWTSNDSVSNLCSGNYTVYVTDSKGCLASDTFSIKNRPAPVFNNTVRHTHCHETCTGSLSVGISGNSTYSLRWLDDNSTSPTRTNLCPDTYIAEITDSNNCIFYDTVVVLENIDMSVHITNHTISCSDTCTGKATALASGNNGPFSYTWSNGETGNVATGLCRGVATVTATDATGCTVSDSVMIESNESIRVKIEALQNTCSEQCTGQAAALASNGEEPFSYKWSSGHSQQYADGLCEGMVKVVATDAMGCSVSDSIMINRQHTFDSLRIWADDYTLFKGLSTTLHATKIPNAIYTWSPTATLYRPNSTDPVATPTDTTTYFLTVTDSTGCTHNDSIKINCFSIDCGRANIFIPNAFTPNDDGKNDRLCFRGEWIQSFHIAIFTRWGELLYESNDINSCWDGRYKDNWCMPGVYVYTCKVTCQDGQESTFKGDVTLIK